jgi:hypothetical protein
MSNPLSTTYLCDVCGEQFSAEGGYERCERAVFQLPRLATGLTPLTAVCVSWPYGTAHGFMHTTVGLTEGAWATEALAALCPGCQRAVQEALRVRRDTAIVEREKRERA